MHKVAKQEMGRMPEHRVLTPAARDHGAQCWLWLAAFFAINALYAPAAAAGGAERERPRRAAARSRAGKGSQRERLSATELAVCARIGARTAEVCAFITEMCADATNCHCETP
jgi:hypothetical protein